MPLSYFLSKEEYPSYQPITEALNMARYKSKWLNKFARLMLGTVQFPAYYLPTNLETRSVSTNETLLFRLWGLTLGMTNDIIEMTHPHISKDQLTFLKPSRAKGYIYSRPDIGYLTYYIAILRYYLLSTKKAVTTSKNTMVNYTHNRYAVIRANMI